MIDDKLATELQELLELLLLDTLTPSDQERLQFLLNTSPEARTYYLNYLQLHLGLKQRDGRQTLASYEAPPSTMGMPASPSQWTRRWTIAMIVAGSLVLALLWIVPAGWSHLARNPAASSENSRAGLTVPAAQTSSLPILLKQNAGARFYQESTPSLGSVMPLARLYFLVDGQIELQFPRGAQVIFEAPAAFRLNSPEQIYVSFGNCSVFAPHGSEGFEVLTPRAQLIDRGTRFNVIVDEFGASDVHVVEGLVDAFHQPESAGQDRPNQEQSQLSEGEARRFSSNNAALSSAIAYTAAHYHDRLPDRLAAFDGPRNEQGEIQRLGTVTVVRNGAEHQYSFPELIGGDVTSFCETSASPTANFIMPRGFQGDRTELFLHDDSFLTGIANPGGSRKPETGPILLPDNSLDRSKWTSGMTIRFRKPVINGPGPDLLFFEVQTAVHPIEGDRFHVRPSDLKQGYHPCTIDQYDLGMLSPESQPISRFSLLETKSPVACLQDLLTMEMHSGHVSLNYRVVATGIDLSQMGLSEGDSLQEIFLQDAQDDEFRIDPVMIAGLPAPQIPIPGLPIEIAIHALSINVASFQFHFSFLEPEHVPTTAYFPWIYSY